MSFATLGKLEYDVGNMFSKDLQFSPFSVGSSEDTQ